ncbi:MAG: hypothetical protein MR051_06495 [Lentisphaeria bacterium]|nr:hypothetical protein [Lentisphaeria bacterium]
MQKKSFREMLDWIRSQIDQVSITKPCVDQSDISPDQSDQLTLLSALKDYAVRLRNEAVILNPQDQEVIDSALQHCLEEIKEFDYELLP